MQKNSGDKMKFYFFDRKNRVVGYKKSLSAFLTDKAELDELACKKNIEEAIMYCEDITGFDIETNKKNIIEQIRNDFFLYGMVKIMVDKTRYKELVKQIKEF